MKDENLDKVINELIDKEESLPASLSFPNENPIYVSTKNELDSTGCGFCLAKWTQVTMHLHNGMTHSCHHPTSHKIPLKELQRNPSALHNTQYKKKKRKEMLEGKRPAECEYCWNIEDTSNRFSDRVFKSSEPWSLPYMEEVKNSNWREDFNPKYVEVAFSNACNFKCSYCGPEFSSTWMKEINKYGGYPTSTTFNDRSHMEKLDTLPIPHKDYNPYVEAFWKWWPELYRSLHTFRITGGEPLLSKDTWKVLDYIIEQSSPNRNLNLGINSNLGAEDFLIERLIQKIQKIEDENRVKELTIFTSVDTWGKQAEYIRHGLEFNRLWDNMNKILERCPRVNITIMCTYNALSIPNFHKLIDNLYGLKQTYSSTDRYWDYGVLLDASYLRYPSHQTVKILPVEYSKKVLEQAQQMLFLGVSDIHSSFSEFTDVEIQKIKRIHDWMNTPEKEENLIRMRTDFYKFFNEHDRRRGTNFMEVFPELSEFYNKCKELC